MRFDPMAMLPFCGYNMGDYFAHWLRVGETADADKLPKIFFVNWFRRGEDGHFLWPGFGENSRVLKWAFERVDGRSGAVETAIGYLPAPGALDVDGLDVDAADLEELVSVDVEGWRAAIPEIEQHYAKFGEHLPEELRDELASLEKRLAATA
jgi:phosphoenolpyruvate carboxykinase (GTP)